MAKQILAHDALGAHARDELGISKTLRARPLQAALASGLQLHNGIRIAAGGRAIGLSIKRVTFLGALAMGVTAGIGALF